MAEPDTSHVLSTPAAGEPATPPAAPPTERPSSPRPRIWATPLLVGLNVVGFAIETRLGCSPTDPTVPQLRAAGAEFGGPWSRESG